MKQKYKYFVGTKDQFDKLVEMNKIEDWYIIFISDTHEIYKGVNRYSTDNFMIKTSKPTNPQQNILYSINGELMYYSEEEGWVSLSKAYSLDVPNEDSTDDTIPTSKGVYEAIKEAIENITIDGKGGITNIQSTKAGILTVTKNSIDTEIPLNGVSLKPSYDNDTRTLTIPVMGDDVPFKVSFANDVYIESGYYNELNQTAGIPTFLLRTPSQSIPDRNGSFLMSSSPFSPEPSRCVNFRSINRLISALALLLT